MALSQFLLSVSALGLDACIHGFSIENLDKLLKLPEKGLTSVVSVGYRDNSDYYQPQGVGAKIRLPAVRRC